MQLVLNNTDYTSLAKRTVIGIITLHYGYKVTRWLCRYFRKVWITNKIPGRFMFPFIGNANLFMNKHSAFLNGFLACVLPYKNQSICRFWIGPSPYISFHSCDNLHVLFDSSKHNKKSFMYFYLREWLGDGLLLSDDEKWQTRRKLITPTFHFDILKDFYEIMNEQSQIMIEELGKEIQKNSNINLAHFIGTCALDTISLTAMGHSINSQRDKNSNYLDALEKVAKVVLIRGTSPWYWSDFIWSFHRLAKVNKKSLKVLHDFTKEVINERISYIKDAGIDKEKRRIAFLDLLIKVHLENPEAMTIGDIREEVDTFMFEGHDTTSSAMEWACYCIARHPEVQKKVYDELIRVIGTSSRNLTMDDLNELKYLECVLKEALRIYPAVPVIQREFTEDCEIEGYKVLKGTEGVILVYQIHRDERYYPEPEKFIPERFLPENTANRHPYAFVPFSAGRRNCIGQRFAMLEYKLFVANILRNFEISCNQTIDDVILEVKLILRTENPIIFNLRSRLQD